MTAHESMQADVRRNGVPYFSGTAYDRKGTLVRIAAWHDKGAAAYWPLADARASDLPTLLRDWQLTQNL